MKLEDFSYMFQGKKVGLLATEEASLLAPIEREGSERNRALLLLHGFSSSPAVYRRLIPLLPLYDTIICPLLPGHGDSIDAMSRARASEWKGHAENVCQRLVDTYEHVDVMGLSLGGLLACHLSHLFHLHHVFLLAPALALRSNLTLTLTAARIARALGLKRIPNYAGNIHTPGFSELTYRQLPLNAVIEILSLIKTFKWQKPNCPVDVFLGRHDIVVDSNQVATLFASVPEAHVHWLEHSAHVLALDGDIDDIISCVRATFS